MKKLVLLLLIACFTMVLPLTAAAYTNQPPGVQVPITILSGRGAINQDGKGLVDGTQVDEADTNRVMFWYTPADYVEFSIPQEATIYRAGTTTWKTYTGDNLTRISRKNDDGTYTDVTDLYKSSSATTQVNETQWAKLFNLMPAGTYRFAYTSNGAAAQLDSEWYAVGTPDTTPPKAPTGLTGEASSSSVTLQWTGVNDADLNVYRIYRNGTAIAEVPKGTTVYKDSGLTPGTTYKYQVSAVDTSTNESAKSNQLTITTPNPPDTSPPIIPGGLKATPGDKKVVLSWTKSNDDTAKYHIYRNGTYLNTVSQPGTTFTVTGLQNGTEYEFQLTAEDAAGNESNKSAAVKATPFDNVPPQVPTGLKASVSGGKATLTWNKNTADSDILRYHIYRDGTYFNSVNHPNTSFVVDLTETDEFNFSLTAEDNAGNESMQSAPVKVKMQMPLSADFRGSKDKIIVTLHGGTAPFTIDWGSGPKTFNSSPYTITGLTPATDYTVTVTDATGKTITQTVNTGLMSAPPDFAGSNLPFGVGDMLKTALNFLKLYGNWILIVLGIIFVPVLLAIVAQLLGFEEPKGKKNSRGKRGKNTKLSGTVMTKRGPKEKTLKAAREKNSPKKEMAEWEKYREKEVKRLKRKMNKVKSLNRDEFIQYKTKEREAKEKTRSPRKRSSRR